MFLVKRLYEIKAKFVSKNLFF